jgi:hypothetical protein
MPVSATSVHACMGAVSPLGSDFQKGTKAFSQHTSPLCPPQLFVDLLSESLDVLTYVSLLRFIQSQIPNIESVRAWRKTVIVTAVPAGPKLSVLAPGDLIYSMSVSVSLCLVLTTFVYA